VEYYQQAISILRRLGHNYNEADVLDRLAQTLQAVGDHLQAHDIWLQAMALYLAQHRTTDADRVQRRLAALKPQSDSI